ncbi:hypothetical protein TNCT_288201 [Trichonephila clavata]|uniref:Uncharacterized protein n=1 Tax=Trichonephila clavata TaxID=2740835 RepID=A0A8X6HKZ3_TRICU|nr:hypothetical protein TNCT_288201 [Trichonephila clavata]
MARVPREEWWLELKQPEELANKFDEFESLKDSLRNNHHGRKQNESRPSHNDKSRFQDNRRKLSDNHARFRDNRGKYNDNHGRSTENHTRFYDKRQTKTEPEAEVPCQPKARLLDRRIFVAMSAILLTTKKCMSRIKKKSRE